MANISIVHTETHDETKPAGSRARSLGDDDIREFKRCIRERLAIDHEFAADEAGETDIGIHKKVTLKVSADPATYDDVGYVYTKTVSGVIELFYKDSAGNIKQLTSAGKLNVATADISSIAVLLTTDQTVAGIKTFSSIPVLPASDPTTDNQASRKKFISDKFDISTGHDHDGIDSKKTAVFANTDVYNGNAPTSYTDLDLSGVTGAIRSIVMLLVLNNGGGGTNFAFRTNGYTQGVGFNSSSAQGAGASGATLEAGYIGYIMVMTDANGVVEWKATDAYSTVITVLGYIPIY